MADVVVVGAGVIGLTSAICLAEDGMDVRIVAAAPPQETTSRAASAMWGSTFAAVAEADPDGAFDAMKESYGAVLADRSLLLIQLQAYAASGDDEVRTMVRRRYAQLYDLVRELSGADREELTQFFAAGMLLNVAAALDLPDLLLNDTWLEDCLKYDAG